MNIDESKLSKSALPLEFKYSRADIDKFLSFKQSYIDWIHSSKQIVKGLPEESFIVSGLTDAFNQTYAIYNKIGIFDGEYGYHLLSVENKVTKDLSQADVIVVSHPFSADGLSSHEKLKIADSYNKPIFVDCAFFGICDNIDFDFSQYKNIHSVCFSLSKTFGTGWCRVGLLFTKDPYPVTVYAGAQYPLIVSAQYHYNLINTKSPDDMFKKYRDKQLEICKELEIIPSDTVMFGLDYSDRYKKFRRGTVNRLCLTQIIENIDIQGNVS
jgi:rRNA maturation protein Nop10